jgi:hypothetical protein
MANLYAGFKFIDAGYSLVPIKKQQAKHFAIFDFFHVSAHFFLGFLSITFLRRVYSV